MLKVKKKLRRGLPRPRKRRMGPSNSAGISYVEDSGGVRKDRTRTPREYLRSVSNATQLAPSGRKPREALSALTMALEQVWYGPRPASNQDFADAMRSVEALGCQLQ